MYRSQPGGTDCDSQVLESSLRLALCGRAGEPKMKAENATGEEAPLATLETLA